MGQPVVHFEIIGKDGDRLRDYYSALFGWEINADNPMNYGIVDREQNLNASGIGIGGGVAGYDDVNARGVTVYVEVPDVEAALQQAESLGGERLLGPEGGEHGVPILGQFKDPEGNRIGVIQT
jgi:predicted enzyme related to lactoylglutathione lyase